MPKRELTIDDIVRSDKPFLTASEVAPLLGADPNSIRGQAHLMPEKLGFPVCVIGTRVRIPRIPFLKFIFGDATLQSIAEGDQPPLE